MDGCGTLKKSQNTNRIMGEGMGFQSLVYRINPFLSIGSGEDEFVAASLCGRIKILKCTPSVLGQALSMVDGKRSLVEISEDLAGRYPREEVDDFMRVLIQEEIIVATETSGDVAGKQSEGNEAKGPESETYRLIVLLGDGCLADTVGEKLQNTADRLPHVRITLEEGARVTVSPGKSKEALEQRLKRKIGNARPDFTVLCPAQATFGEMMAFNDTCLSLQIPFLFCYFNGTDIILGPMVIPNKTPCYGCLLEHRRHSISEKGNLALRLDHLYPLTEAWPCADGVLDPSTLDWMATHVVREILNFRRTGLPLSLLTKQVRISPQKVNHFPEVTFEPITACPSCRGMSGGNLRWGNPREPSASVSITLEKRPVVYRNGGRRSVSVGETVQMVDKALERAGLEVKIERLTDGALDDVLFRYTAAIRSNYHARLPFYVPEDLTQRGKGITEEQAYLSAAFELFERICSRYYGDMEMVRASYGEVRDVAFDLESYIGRTFHEGVMESFDEDAPIDWVWAYSLVHKRPRLVPASIAFITASKLMGQFFDDSSGGLAAGATLEDAILQALFEVIEHDAWIIWQANAITLPEVRQDTIGSAKLRSVLEQIRSHGFRAVVRDYTTDFSIPVFRTWIVNDRDYRTYATNGFGVNLDPDIALERSISEAWLARGISTLEEQLHYGGPLAREMAFSYYSLYSLYHFNQMEILGNGRTKDYRHFSNQATDSVVEDIEKTISLLRKQLPEVDVLVVNLTKEVLQVPVVRVLVGGGVQRFAEPSLSMSQRVFDLPVKFGYRQERLKYEQLYNGPFPH